MTNTMLNLILDARALLVRGRAYQQASSPRWSEDAAHVIRQMDQFLDANYPGWDAQTARVPA